MKNGTVIKNGCFLPTFSGMISEQIPCSDDHCAGSNIELCDVRQTDLSKEYLQNVNCSFMNKSTFVINRVSDFLMVYFKSFCLLDRPSQYRNQMFV